MPGIHHFSTATSASATDSHVGVKCARVVASARRALLGLNFSYTLSGKLLFYTQSTVQCRPLPFRPVDAVVCVFRFNTRIVVWATYPIAPITLSLVEMFLKYVGRMTEYGSPSAESRKAKVFLNDFNAF